MSFPQYPKYKDSCVEWLGEVPEHWEVEPFKRQIERNDGGVWGDDPDGLDDTIVLRSTEQSVDGRWQLDDPAPRKLTESEINAALLIEGDLLLTKSSGSSLHIGKTTLVTPEIAAMRCCYSNFMQRIRTKASFSPKLAWHVLTHHNLKNLGKRVMPLNEGETPMLAPITEAGSGSVQEPATIYMGELIEKLNELFGADTTDQDRLVYVNHVIKGKLLESETLKKQAMSNTKEQFANSPDLKTELVNAIMGALDAHTAMSTQALNSPVVQSGMKDILLNHSQLWETLRQRAAG